MTIVRKLSAWAIVTGMSAIAIAQVPAPAPSTVAPTAAEDDDVFLARKDAESGVYFRAEEMLQGTLEDHPERDDARLLLLDVLRAQGKYDAADALDRELEARPSATSVDALTARARYAFERGRLDACES